MMKRIASIVFAVLMLAVSAGALEMEGVQIPETITQADGTQLVLNGAGVRSKFIFDIYIAQLYLKEKNSDAAAVIQADAGRRIGMHFLYSEVSKEKLVETWNEGFEKNGTKEQLSALKGEMDAFNDMFETVKEGDQVFVDYIPGTGTTVTIKGVKKGTIPGKEFNDLMLAIYLGKNPVTDDLKDEMLGK